MLGEDGLPPNPGDSILPLEVPEDAWTLFQCSYAAPRSTADEDAFCSIDAQPIDPRLRSWMHNFDSRANCQPIRRFERDLASPNRHIGILNQ